MAEDQLLDTDAEAEPARKKAPADYQSAAALMEEALNNPELSPAVKAVLSPFQWYVNRLKQDIDTLQAPLRWLESFREKVEAQQQKDAAWQRLVQAAELRPFDAEADGRRVWVTHQPWQPGPGWVQVQDVAADSAYADHHITVWANPTLRAVATEDRTSGTTFVTRFPSQAAFIQQLHALQAPGREPEAGR